MAHYCKECGSEELHENDFGIMVCAECGTQDQDYVQEEMELGTQGLNQIGNPLRARKKQRAPVDSESESEEEEEEEPIDLQHHARAYCEVFQRILQMQVEVLVHKSGCHPLMASTVRQLWFKYLRFTEVLSPLYVQEQSKLKNNQYGIHTGEKDNKKRKKKRKPREGEVESAAAEEGEGRIAEGGDEDGGGARAGAQEADDTAPEADEQGSGRGETEGGAAESSRSRKARKKSHKKDHKHKKERKKDKRKGKRTVYIAEGGCEANEEEVEVRSSKKKRRRKAAEDREQSSEESPHDVEGGGAYYLKYTNTKGRCKVEGPPPETLLRRMQLRNLLANISKQLPLSMTLSLLHLAAIINREPITAKDLCDGASCGNLPFLGAYSKLDPVLRLGIYTALLRPSGVPDFSTVEDISLIVSSRLRLVLPPVNAVLLARRYLAELRLPSALIGPITRLHALIPLPQMAFARWTEPTSGHSRSPKTMRYVMALVVTSAKLVYGLDGLPRTPLPTAIPRSRLRCSPPPAAQRDRQGATRQQEGRQRERQQQQQDGRQEGQQEEGPALTGAIEWTRWAAEGEAERARRRTWPLRREEAEGMPRAEAEPYLRYMREHVFPGHPPFPFMERYLADCSAKYSIAEASTEGEGEGHHSEAPSWRPILPSGAQRGGQVSISGRPDSLDERSVSWGRYHVLEDPSQLSAYPQDYRLVLAVCAAHIQDTDEQLHAAVSDYEQQMIELEARLALAAPRVSPYRTKPYVVGRTWTPQTESEQEDGAPAAESAEDDDVACEVCGERDTSQENNIVLCDVCNHGIHQLCLIPARSWVPRGEWFCGVRCMKQHRLSDANNEEEYRMDDPSVSGDSEMAVQTQQEECRMDDYVEGTCFVCQRRTDGDEDDVVVCDVCKLQTHLECLVPPRTQGLRNQALWFCSSECLKQHSRQLT